MTQSVGDLVVSLDVDSARFTEQVAFVKKALKDSGTAANDATLQVQQAFSRQEISARKAGISVGQYNAAMRSLPAQFTDIATQLAGGQSPFLIMMEQGGQIKDQFGGVKGALTGVGDYLRTLTGLITPTTVGIGALVGGVALLAYTWYQSSQQATAYNQALAKTGNISGQTAESLSRITDQIAKSADAGKSATAAAVALATGMGLTIDQIRQVSETALNLSKNTGQSVEDLVNQLGKVAQDPLKGFIDLNEQYNFANLALYEQVRHMVDLGDKAGATKLIIDSLSDSQKKFSDNAKGDIDELSGYWEQLITKIKSYKTWYDRVSEQATTVKLPDFQIGTGSVVVDQINAEMAKGDKTRKDNTDAQIEKENHLAAIRNQQNQITAEFNKAQVEANIQADEFLKSARTNAQIRNDLQAKYQRQLDQGMITQDKFNKLIAAANEKYKDPKTPKGKGVTVSAGDRAEDTANAELLALQSQLKVLQQHQGINDVISQQRKDLWKTESQFTVLEDAAGKRKLSKQEQSLLASKDQVLALAQQKALLGDQITAQEQLNKRMDTASKYVNQMGAKQDALNQSSTLSDRQSSRQASIAQLQSGWKNAGGQLTDDGYQRELTALQNYYAAEDKLRGDWQAGMKKGWAEFEDSATNTYAQVQQISQSAFTGMSSQLTDFLTSGKSNFKDFLSTFLKGIVQMISQLMILKTMKSALGGTWAGSLLGFAGGGYVPAYDSGGYTGDGGKYEPKGVVHGGEFVFTKESTARLGVGNLYRLMRGYASGGYVGNQSGSADQVFGGVSVYAPVSINQGSDSGSVNNASTAGTAKQLQGIIQTTINDRLKKEMSPGGLLYKNG